MSERLAQRVALITGAAQGIGRATALRFAAEGATVVVADLTTERGEETAAAVRAQGGIAHVLAADVSKSAEATRLVDEAVAAAGAVDILVNNAGIFPRSTVADMADDHWESVLAVNLSSALYMSRAALPYMTQRGFGRIVNVTSRMALQGVPGGAAYAASKAGIIGLTKSLALEVAEAGVNVNAVSPGVTATPMVLDGNDPEWVERFAQTLPYKRLWEPEDIVGSILYLASDDSTYVTGQVVYVWQ
jgi:3-oxoacyl-[acyl-carrier protein] reductase